jgi:hypothetical protein
MYLCVRTSASIGGEVSDELVIPDDLKLTCPLCKGSGYVKRTGFSSAGDMDANSTPRLISRTCMACKGKGWIWSLTQDEMAQRIARLEQQLANARKEALTVAAEKIGSLIRRSSFPGTVEFNDGIAEAQCAILALIAKEPS